MGYGTRNTRDQTLTLRDLTRLFVKFFVLLFTRWQIAAVILATLVVCLLVAPRFLAERFIREHPALHHGPLNATEVLLEINTDAVRKGALQALAEDARRVLSQADILFIRRAVRGNAVEVQPTRAADVKAAVAKLGELSQSVPGVRFFNIDVINRPSIDISVNGDLIMLTPSDAAITERIRQTVNQSIEIIRRRINKLGLIEPTIQRQDLDRILVVAPGLRGPPMRVLEILSKSAKLELRIVDLSMSVEQAIATQPPADSEILDGQKGEKYLVEKSALISGADLADAQPAFDQRTNEPLIAFRFNSSGARKFAEATQQNVGRPFAIVLDNKVLSAPVIQEPILGDSGQITGNFTVQQANDLAVMLRAGALPAPLFVVEGRFQP